MEGIRGGRGRTTRARSAPVPLWLPTGVRREVRALTGLNSGLGWSSPSLAALMVTTEGDRLFYSLLGCVAPSAASAVARGLRVRRGLVLVAAFDVLFFDVLRLAPAVERRLAGLGPTERLRPGRAGRAPFITSLR